MHTVVHIHKLITTLLYDNDMFRLSVPVTLICIVLLHLLSVMHIGKIATSGT
jgi:hypothetical protein